MNARAASSASTTREHRFPWRWRLADLGRVRRHGRTVFSCFACGGGSSMGYKLAGYEVLGNVEIDPRIAAVYRQNLHPRHSFVMDVRDFLKLPDAKIPPELLDLDVLDGSPPCSTFSMAGKREDGWGKQKRFAEGQALQRLDDLFFTFIAIAERLKPRVVIAENVKGLTVGSARGYVHEIIGGFKAAGYESQVFLLDASRMGVPQRRERVFFIARRQDLNLPQVKLSFREPPIPFGEVRTVEGVTPERGWKYMSLLRHRRRSDAKIGDICMRLCGRLSGFTRPIYWDDAPALTLSASGVCYRGADGMAVSAGDVVNVSTFPQDYAFGNRSPRFICGMSVPPVMAAQVAAAVAEQCLGVPAPAGGFE